MSSFISSSRFASVIIREVLPGSALVILGFTLIHLSRTSLSLVALATVFSLFLAGAVVSRSVMRTVLGRLYSWKYFDLVSPMFFSVPLILALHTGYMYAYAYIDQVLELVSSMLIGLGLFLALHPALRVI
ncbi:MAG: hypothetical protein QXT64_02940 [Desulfurococcaceae archaeon]